jgi:hypothetical protein
MSILNKLKQAAAKEGAKAVIGKTLPLAGKKGISKGKMTLGALVLAVAGLVFEYLS